MSGLFEGAIYRPWKNTDGNTALCASAKSLFAESVAITAATAAKEHYRIGLNAASAHLLMTYKIQVAGGPNDLAKRQCWHRSYGAED